MASSSSQSKRGNEDMNDLDTIVQARNSRKHRNQKFLLEWCKDDELRDWLLPDMTFIKLDANIVTYNSWRNYQT